MRRIFSLALASVLASNAQAHSHNTQAAAELANKAVDYYTYHTPGASWLHRTSLNFNVIDDANPGFSLETIQPLYQNKIDTYFWQGRFDRTNTDETLNFGLGWRHLYAQNKRMFGLNAFYDFSDKYNHRRIGAGMELFGEQFNFRANIYDAQSGEKLIGEVPGDELEIDHNIYGQVLSGYDYELESVIPWLPWASIAAKGYTWQGVDLTDIKGWTVTLRTYPSRFIEFDTGVTKDDFDDKLRYFAKFNLYLGQPDFLKQASSGPWFAPHQFKSQNVKEMRLIKVRRHNDMVVETKQVGTAGGVSIGRGA